MFYVFLFILKFYTPNLPKRICVQRHINVYMYYTYVCVTLHINLMQFAYVVNHWIKISVIRKIVRKLFLKIGRNLTNIGQNVWYPVVASIASLMNLGSVLTDSLLID